MNEFIIFFRLMDHYWYKRYVTNIHWLAIIFRKCPLWPIISKDSLTINLKQIKFLKLEKRTKNILLLMSCLTPYHVQLVLKTENVKLSNFAIFSKKSNKKYIRDIVYFQSSSSSSSPPQPSSSLSPPQPSSSSSLSLQSNPLPWSSLSHPLPL